MSQSPAVVARLRREAEGHRTLAAVADRTKGRGDACDYVLIKLHNIGGPRVEHVICI